ncbi:putative JmjC domain-containing histone demethylation protein 2C [Platysternon megacephalum]|uniref:Putative JmjC domain-containing histone demethylation protein 2C n=1 Tax=Platysternon megacephalum TaxID=55544 RepID=A0A4D9F251_9SAUR|nr:putative JmjC domain-containing histone demethylation protein 2C [Platysternon megacephalum]
MPSFAYGYSPAQASPHTCSHASGFAHAHRYSTKALGQLHTCAPPDALHPRLSTQHSQPCTHTNTCTPRRTKAQPVRARECSKGGVIPYRPLPVSSPPQGYPQDTPCYQQKGLLPCGRGDWSPTQTPEPHAGNRGGPLLVFMKQMG